MAAAIRGPGDWPAGVGLTEHQAAVMARYVAERETERRHLVVHLSGAHAYGFPSPDSDLDVKAVHVVPTASLLGLRSSDTTASEITHVEGVEVDYTSNEIGPVLAGCIKGNGNYLERALGSTTVATTPWLDELRPIVARSVNRRLAAHYRGFATQQRRALDDKPTAKRLLYVLRTALTGIHALRSGEIVPHLPSLAAEYELDGVSEMIERKRQGEQTALDPETAGAWNARIDRLFQRLDEATAASPLPEAAPNEPELEDWLVALRRRLL